MYTVQFYKHEYHNLANAVGNAWESSGEKKDLRNLAGATLRVVGLAAAIFCAIAMLHAAYIAAGTVTIGSYALFSILSRDLYIVGRNLNHNFMDAWTLKLPLIGPERSWNFIHKIPFFPNSVGATHFKARYLSKYTQDTNILNQLVSIL